MYRGYSVYRFYRPLRKEPLHIHPHHIVPAHQEGTARIVLHASIVSRVAQLLRHPRLCVRQVHASGDDEDEAQTLTTRCHVRHDDAQLLLARRYLRPAPFGIVDMVEVVDGEPRGNRLGIEAAPVLESGMGREDGQLLFQIPLERFKVLRREFAPHLLLPGILDFGADARHMLIV